MLIEWYYAVNCSLPPGLAVTKKGNKFNDGRRKKFRPQSISPPEFSRKYRYSPMKERRLSSTVYRSGAI